MHDSYTPLGGLIPLFNIETGEVIFGGTGAGLYGILLYAILAVFIAGLMVGRTPEYLGKKIEGKEVKMAMLALIATAASTLLMSGISAAGNFNWDGSKYLNPASASTKPVPETSVAPTANLNNVGPHGFAEILYAYSSATGNNGSAFGGISANTPWYNGTLGVVRVFANRHCNHRGCAHVLPGPFARADCGALSNAEREAVFVTRRSSHVYNTKSSSCSGLHVFNPEEAGAGAPALRP